ncbi:MAG: DUF721 domain-containing protein [Armatimonadota bacterium]|nr:DUF721 domain-containing protein [Armatimonadota bacterium]MCX7776449.1 DUF721 domain-containing protein [Armatimonadota bacterium]MDW8024247.1 DUF721 domain-containing protein [Armatimonadota bacterium]
MKDRLISISEVIEDWVKRSKKLKGNVNSASQGRDFEESRQQQLVFSCWEEAVGKKVASVVTPYKFERGILYVCTESSSWAQEISFMKMEIIRKINEKLGGNFVADIYCRIGMPGGIAKQRRGERESKTLIATQLAKIKLPKEIEQRVNEMVSAIQNDELRDLMRRVFTLHMKLKLWRQRHGLKRCENCGEVYKADEKACPICSIKE